MTLQVVDGSQLNLCSVNSRRETETVTKRLIVESEPVKPEIPPRISPRICAVGGLSRQVAGGFL